MLYAFMFSCKEASSGYLGTLCTTSVTSYEFNICQDKKLKQIKGKRCETVSGLYTLKRSRNVVEEQLFHFMFCTSLRFLSLETDRN